MGLAGEGTQAHATGAEAGTDALDALHLVDRQGHRRRSELQQVAQGRHGPVLEQGFVGGEVVVARAGLDGGMEGLGHLRAVEVVFATGAVLHKAHELELGAIEFWESLGVEGQGFTGQIAEAQARHPAGGAAERQGNEVGANANRLKDLGAVVTGQQGNADLGEDLAQAIFEGLAHIGLGLVGREGWQFAPLDQRLHLGLGQPMAGGFPGEPGANGTGAVADQAGQVVGAPALGRVNNEGGLQAQSQVEQVVVHRPHRQQGRDRAGGGINAGRLATLAPAIRQHHDRCAGAHGRLGLPTQPLHGVLKAPGAL